MATFVEELVDDLVTAGIVTGKGTDAFYNELPDTDASPVTVVALQATGGVPSVGVPAPWHSVQCIVRSVTSWEAARVKAAQIYNRYHDAVNLTLANYRVLASKALAPPAYIGLDTRKRYLVSTNYTFKVGPLSVVDPLEITAFSFFEIGKTSAKVQYAVNRPAQCIIYTRKETPLGSWVQAPFATYHTTHLHTISGLVTGQWYQLYIYAVDAGAVSDTYPTNPPWYRRFQTATDTEVGVLDPGLYQD